MSAYAEQLTADIEFLNYLSAIKVKEEFDRLPPLVAIDLNKLGTEKVLLGNGKFGSVNKQLLDGTPVASKSLLPADNQENGLDVLEIMMKREAYLMQLYNIPGVVRSIGVDNATNPTTIYMEYGVGTLRDAIAGKLGEFNFQMKLSVLLQLCETFANLHSSGVIHRDIKSSNIIVMPDRVTYKVTDFGISRSTVFGNSAGVSPKGTHAYMAPELLMYADKYSYSEQTDMYAFAIMMNEVLSGETPFKDFHVQQLIGKMYSSDGKERPTLYNGPIADILAPQIEKRWSTKVEDRGTFQELLTFFRGLSSN